MEAGFKANGTFNYYLKNQQNTNCSTTAKNGVNLERNFPFMWNATTSDGCADNYAGTSSLNATEVSALVTFVSKLKPKAWIHFDGRSAVYVTPFAFTSDKYAYKSKDLEDFYSIALKNAAPSGFNYGSASVVNGIANGTLLDYAASVGSLGLQIGSSSALVANSSIGSEVAMHDNAVGMLSGAASFLFSR